MRRYQFNDWHKHNEDLWMCAHWDVHREGDHWRATSYLGTAVERKFDSPQQAMNYLNDLDNRED